MFPKIANLWANVKTETNLQEMQQSEFVTLHKVKVLQKEKVLK
jgi:hypothetical protein